MSFLFQRVVAFLLIRTYLNVFSGAERSDIAEKTLLSEGHIDKTAAKWLSLIRLILRKSQYFYTLTKIHKPTPVERPIISGCSGPTERISAFVDHLIQPIAELQGSYLKDTTDFINFIEKIKLPKSACFNGRHKPLHKHTTTRG